MSIAVVENELKTAFMASALSILDGPEGLCFGRGTTVGNGIEGWAPGALFIDTNAAAGSQFYVNEGTKTTAAFKAVPNLATAQTFTGAQTISGVLVRSGGDKTPMISVPDGAAYTVLAANSGKIHLILNQAQDATLTLPAAAAGLYYEFWSTMEAADGHDWLIVTGSDTNFYKGGVLWCKSDVAEATASEVTIVVPNGSDDATIQINLPSVGTVVKMYCDGTNWFLTGFVMSVATPSYT
ncbi:hypothetical protein LCGC14_0589770 [marine sediment metagenome]|uniref:Uncharacterized protein n=1 Tax=marine sediment metagenome TaxID=412755 RepID=A0A0F9UM83_9ZZZZ